MLLQDSRSKIACISIILSILCSVVSVRTRSRFRRRTKFSLIKIYNSATFCAKRTAFAWARIYISWRPQKTTGDIIDTVTTYRVCLRDLEKLFTLLLRDKNFYWSVMSVDSGQLFRGRTTNCIIVHTFKTFDAFKLNQVIWCPRSKLTDCGQFRVVFIYCTI